MLLLMYKSNEGGDCGKGTFFIFGVLKPGVGCIIKIKLTSILAPNIYDCSERGGGLLPPRRMIGTLSKCWYKTQVVRASKRRNSPNFA